MTANAKRDADAGTAMPATFNIQVCSKDGRLISEYTLTRHDHDVGTLSAAERCARTDLSDYKGEPLVIIVTEETLTKFRQVQLKVSANQPYSECGYSQAANSGSSRVIGGLRTV